MNKNVSNHLEHLLTRYPELSPIRDNLQTAYSILEKLFFNSRILFICGNGGSASDAEHITGELMKSFLIPRAMPPDTKMQFETSLGEEDISGKLQMGFRAICLNGHPALSSAYGNDVDPLMCYAQQLFVLGSKDDVLLGISTSGNALNVLNAFKVARARGITTILLTGAKSGACMKYADIAIQAPATETYRIQEYHLPIYHTLCMMIEEHFYGRK